MVLTAALSGLLFDLRGNKIFHFLIRKHLIFTALWLFCMLSYAQQNSLSVLITDASGGVLPGAVAVLLPSKQVAVADSDGIAVFNGLSAGKYRIEVSFLGFETYITDLQLPVQGLISIRLNQKLMNLQEVRIIAPGTRIEKPMTILPSETVNQVFLERFYAGSLSATLERLPGINSIRIGMGQSKPMIRGLAFNRVLVVDDGMRHEGQQWGEEHGLEVDALSAAKVELIKGPASVRYGSDAIGGVLRINSAENLSSDGMEGQIKLYAASVNWLIGGDAQLNWKEKSHNAYIGLGGWDAADYKVPSDYVDVYNFRLKLPNGRLRNTAGFERNIRAGYGTESKHWKHQLRFSAISSRQGFFAHAHGIEPRKVDTLLHDQSRRDVLFPYHQITHIKLLQTSRLLTKSGILNLMIGYQKNLMEEQSDYVSHGFMPPVLTGEMLDKATLERFFNKSTIAFEAFWEQSHGQTEWKAGITADDKRNLIDGWAFVFPEYRSGNIGAFALLNQKHDEKQLLQTGLRVDASNIRISEYRDWFVSPDGFYRVRAENKTLNYLSLTWSLGYKLNLGHWSISTNAGKSFRLPTAAELGANGVNYHQFRFEQGNPDLKPETSYQMDILAEWKNSRLALELSPFIAYSPNYIYLNPTPEHDYLYGNGNQKFAYTQSMVIRAGGEAHAHYGLTETITLGMMLEVLRTQQLSGAKKGYGLPLTPPASMLFNANWMPRSKTPIEISANIRLTSAQNRIVPPEEATPAWYVVNLRANTLLKLGQQPLDLSIQLNNITNNIYFNHLSYYRRINLPEAGRNVVVMARFPFEKKSKPQKKN